MKELHGTASRTVAAPVEDCYGLLEAVDGYPAWHPDVVRSVEVLERGADGRPSRARATLHVAVGPLVRDFNLVLAVELEALRRVKLIRQRNEPSDQEQFVVSWRLEPDGERATRIAIELDANLSVPRLVPLGGIGDSMAEGFVSAAARALTRSR
jgi:ribosome-associated toxin RatA of RatAB toxin-antitoxin module